MTSRDPEVEALTSRVRSLTEMAQALSCEIHETLSELTEFQDGVMKVRRDLDRREIERRQRPSSPWPKEKERRRDDRA